MKFLIVNHRNNWHSLIWWRANCPWKDKWTRECFAWDQVKFERELHLSAQALALCWDTLLGVLSNEWMLALEAQETASSRPDDDWAFVFDLLKQVWSVFCLWWQINLKLTQIIQTAGQTPSWHWMIVQKPGLGSMRMSLFVRSHIFNLILFWFIVQLRNALHIKVEQFTVKTRKWRSLRQ